MAKFVVMIAIVSALCMLSLAGLARAETRLYVDGKVYCDTCRVQFITLLTSYVKDARVKLECRETEGGSVTYSQEVVTDESGSYKIPVDGDHEDEICEVKLVKSSIPACSEIKDKLSARVSLTNNNGMSTPYRHANPLGFLLQIPLPDCPDVLRKLGIDPNTVTA